jgi:AraC family transcriptional regulator of adaptative response/methylated-DNA-[protein]-cysteine methyltransferase
MITKNHSSKFAESPPFLDIKATEASVFFKNLQLVLTYGVHDTFLGECWIVICEKEIFGAGFQGTKGLSSFLQKQKKKNKSITLVEDSSVTLPYLKKILELFKDSSRNTSLPLLLVGSPFQLKVWQTLLEIPKGKTVSYQDIALKIAAPQSMRAVGNAVGQNPVSLLVPCHRVIQKNGALGGFLWGSSLKKKLLALEQEQTCSQ